MIEITDGFTHISAGSDSIEDVPEDLHASSHSSRPRSPTGVRVVVEFSCKVSLAAGQSVTARYDFAGDGNLREGVGIAMPIRTDVRWGSAVLYHYRLSYWIAPSALMNFAAREVRVRASLPPVEFAIGARAADPTPA